MTEKPTYAELEKRVQELENAKSMDKQSEETLSESEQKFKTMFEQAPLTYQSLDEDGNFKVVNQTWLDTLGYSRDEVIGKSFGNFLHPDWKDHFKENFPRFKAIGEILGVEFEMIKKDGSLILVSFHGKISKDKNGNFQQAHCIIKDITQLKQAEEELRLFKTVVESSQEAIAISDPDGQLVYINPAHERLFGRCLEEAQKLNYRDYYPPESIEILNKVVAPALKRNESWEGILDAFDAEGRCFPLWERAGTISDSEGNMFYGFGLMHDDSERRRTEENLRDSEEKYRSILEKIEDGYFEVDLAGNFTFFNDSMCRILGYSSNELMGMNNRAYMDPETAEKVYK